MGDIDIYLYEFDNRTIPASLANIDTFDQVMGYAGNLMKSFGMPYIQFFTTDGKELFVQKSNPMALTYTIANMVNFVNNNISGNGKIFVTVANAAAGDNWGEMREVARH
jgi:hypothetical protein